ncbi:MAG: ferritin family protein [Gammaproteobacteria bacterium]
MTTCSRRTLLKIVFSGVVSWELGLWSRLCSASAYPETMSALQIALTREQRARELYIQSASRAEDEGFKGVAYLLVAMAASEAIHGKNFQKVLTTLGASVEDQASALAVKDTKQNLITAANDELDTIDNLYPETLEKIKPEGYKDAITYVEWALQSEKQHRDMIEQVQRYTDSFFGRVIKAISELTTHYFVCQVCGSTVTEMPKQNCPVCASAASNYVRVARPA